MLFQPILTLRRITHIHLDLQFVCQQVSRSKVSEVFGYIERLSASSRTLLLACILLSRGSRSGIEASAEADFNNAHRYYGHGTRLFREQLSDSETASSDENIQAVLLLIAYASDAGYVVEGRIHLGALSRMVEQRGGLGILELESDPVLFMQLQALPRSRRFHLTTGSITHCTHELRFPDVDSLEELLAINRS